MHKKLIAFLGPVFATVMVGCLPCGSDYWNQYLTRDYISPVIPTEAMDHLGEIYADDLGRILEMGFKGAKTQAVILAATDGKKASPSLIVYPSPTRTDIFYAGFINTTAVNSTSSDGDNTRTILTSEGVLDGFYNLGIQFSAIEGKEVTVTATYMKRTFRIYDLKLMLCPLVTDDKKPSDDIENCFQGGVLDSMVIPKNERTGQFTFMVPKTGSYLLMTYMDRRAWRIFYFGSYWICQIPTCGDGVIEGGETCDDGFKANSLPNQSGDGCSTDCQVEEGWDCLPKHLSNEGSCVLYRVNVRNLQTAETGVKEVA